LGITIEEVLALKDAVGRSGKVLQVGHMKRFDQGLQAAKLFVDTEMGELLALKAWYCDSTHRYAMTEATQPLIVASASRRKPPQDPKADMRRYLMLAHGCHLVDTARYLAGAIVAVQARLAERFGARCWFVDTEFANGALGHLDLTVAVRMDWHEGFQVYGQNGSVIAKTYNPWFYKSSDVEIFHEKDATTRRPLGADGGPELAEREMRSLQESRPERDRNQQAHVEERVAEAQREARQHAAVHIGRHDRDPRAPLTSSACRSCRTASPR